jgi:hypothetical protein
MIEVLATAKVNELYRWKTTFSKCKIDATVEDGNVLFLEYFNGNVNVLNENLVASLFPLGISVPDRPFLIRDNQDFYTVLYRNKKRFHEKYEEIVKRKHVPIKKIKRTK